MRAVMRERERVNWQKTSTVNTSGIWGTECLCLKDLGNMSWHPQHQKKKKIPGKEYSQHSLGSLQKSCSDFDGNLCFSPPNFDFHFDCLPVCWHV